MFEQSIVGEQDSRRPWTFSLSVMVQALLVALAILIPLLGRPMLPALSASLVSLRAPATAPPELQRQSQPARPQAFDAALIPPRRTPRSEASSPEVPQNPFALFAGPQPTLSARTLDVVPPTPVVRLPRPQPAVQPEAPSELIRVSSVVQAARILRRVEPVYPPLAIQMRVSGVVRLRAIIAADGTIAELRVISGHPVLVRAALDAVRQWRYRPTALNGTPVAVQTIIDVNFRLSC